MARKTKHQKTKHLQEKHEETIAQGARVVLEEQPQEQEEKDKQVNYENGDVDDYNYDDDDDDLSSEEEGEDLILEGVLVRNPDVESSDDSGDDVSRDDSYQDDNEPLSKKIKGNNHEKQSTLNQKKKKKNRSKEREVEIIPVEFTFHDMNENYFHGIKNFLLSHPIYASHSSDIADLIIDNVSVGTVVSTDDGQDNVYGFASVLNISSYSSNTSIQDFKRLCLNACPEQHKHEMETVLSGKTRRPAGIFMHGRMVNLPLEITHVLHEQLVQDMKWAVEHAEGGEEQRKSLNFGAFVLLAPCLRDPSDNANGIVYKNFDDEIFAECAEFVYPLNPSDWRKMGSGGGVGEEEEEEMVKQNQTKKNKKKKQTMGAASQSAVSSEKDFVNVIVMTRTGHDKAMKQLHQLIHGSGGGR